MCVIAISPAATHHLRVQVQDNIDTLTDMVSSFVKHIVETRWMLRFIRVKRVIRAIRLVGRFLKRRALHRELSLRALHSCWREAEAKQREEMVHMVALAPAIIHL